MRVNTPKSIAFGESLHDEFGSWNKALEAAQLRNGVYVLPRKSEKTQGADGTTKPPRD